MYGSDKKLICYKKEVGSSGPFTIHLQFLKL